MQFASALPLLALLGLSACTYHSTYVPPADGRYRPAMNGSNLELRRSEPFVPLPRMGCVDRFGYWFPPLDEDPGAYDPDHRVAGGWGGSYGGGYHGPLIIVARGAPPGYMLRPPMGGVPGRVPASPTVGGAMAGRVPASPTMAGAGGATAGRVGVGPRQGMRRVTAIHPGAVHGGGGGGGNGDLGKGAIVLVVLAYVLMPTVAIAWAADSPGDDSSTAAMDDANRQLEQMRAGVPLCAGVPQ